MADFAWIANSKSDNRYDPLAKVFKQCGIEAEIVIKEKLYDKISEPLALSSIPILILLDPELPESLIEKLKEWRSNLKWYGAIQSPIFVFMVHSDKIRQAQKKWDPSDSNDYDFEILDQLYKSSIAKNKIDGARKNRKHAEFGLLIGESKCMQHVGDFIEKLKDKSSHVLILGESGTGKELVARSLHVLGKRSEYPFIACNVPTLPKDLVESHLFGHEEGSFTGATSTSKGFCEQAHKGTLFLDEIGELQLHLQSKILRFMQDGRVQKVGEKREKQVDVRVVAATNQDLEKMVREGKFRSDLFWRLDVVSIEIPPLRKRKEDVPGLVKYFCLRFAENPGKIKTFGPKALEALCAYEWPGNVRELENAVERGYVLSGQNKIPYECLPQRIQSWFERKMPIKTPTESSNVTYPPNAETFGQGNFSQDRDNIKEAMKLCNGDIRTVLTPFKYLLNPRGNTRFDPKSQINQNKLNIAIEGSGQNVRTSLELLRTILNPDGNKRLGPDKDQCDQERLKMAIDLCRGNIQSTSHLLIIIGYEDNSSIGFIKNRLGLDKSNMKNVIEELAEWYRLKYRS